ANGRGGAFRVLAMRRRDFPAVDTIRLRRVPPRGRSGYRKRNLAMARAIWKGAISFGLVNIPVELYSAEDRKAFKFSMLDKRDLSPVGYKRYSKKTNKEVEWSNIVKGYEYEKDRYV